VHAVIIAACIVMFGLDHYLEYFGVLLPFSSFLIMFILAIAIIGALNGHAKSKYYVIAWALFIIGGLLYAAKALGLMPANFVTEGVFQIGLVLQALSLSIGMSFSIYDEQKQLNTRLETQVAERTRELNYTNEQLNETNRQLEQLSVTDPLTGLHNRRKFSELHAVAQAQALRYGASSALLMIDVDYFKNYNDHYGHVQGDECLRSIAKALKDNVPREGDFCCRYGGEEFLVYLAAVTRSGCASVAHRLLHAVQQLSIPHNQSPHTQVTISIGCVVLSPKKEFLPLSQCIEKADKALYQAKTQGRNTVCLYPCK
jgi:diguanylate cyclase (GGDEF)-like protein